MAVSGSKQTSNRDIGEIISYVLESGSDPEIDCGQSDKSSSDDLNYESEGLVEIQGKHDTNNPLIGFCKFRKWKYNCWCRKHHSRKCY